MTRDERFLVNFLGIKNLKINYKKSNGFSRKPRNPLNPKTPEMNKPLGYRRSPSEKETLIKYNIKVEV